MSTAFDAYSRPAQQPFGQPKTAFGAMSSQQKPAYQSVPQMAQSAAANTSKAKLDQNRQGSYLSYIDQVVNAELPSDEGAARASYIPNAFGTSQGSTYINPNAAMAGGAVPAAYEFAGMKNGEFDYGVDRLEWGGPASGKSAPNDWLDRGRITQGRNQAEDALRRAIIPDYLRQDVSNKLANEWTQGWGQEFQGLANDRRDQQANWWNGSNWASNSFTPAWTEEISPATRDLLTPFVPGRAGVEEIPAQEFRAEVPFRPYVQGQEFIAPQRNLISPEVQGQAAIAAGYYTPSQQEYNDWVTQEQQAKQNEVFTQTKDGQSVTFPAWQATEWQDERDRHVQNLRDVYPFWQNQLASWNLDPTSPNNGFYQNEQFHGGQGQIRNHFTDNTGFDAFGNPFNSDLGYTAFGEEAGYLNMQSLFPDIWGNYQPGQEAIEQRDAVWEDIPGQAFIPHDPGQAFVPGQEARPYVPGVEALPDIPATYLDLPAVMTTHPMEPRSGFSTVVDPITGTAIPNWWLNGGLGSNSDLAETYGTPNWYLK